MKKRLNNSALAFALQITISVALLAVSAILFASSFRGAPQIPNPAAPDRHPGFYPALPDSKPFEGRFYPPLPDSAPELAPTITVSLPIDNFSTTVPASTIIIEPLTTTLIDPTTTSGDNYVGFQGDFTFDSAVVGFDTPQVQRAGLTSDPNWNVSSNVLNTGPGTTRTLRISALMNTFVPLNGVGTLFEMRM